MSSITINGKNFHVNGRNIVRSLVDDKAVAAALRDRLSAALAKAIEEKAGSIVRSLTKVDIASLLAPPLGGSFG